MKISLQEMHVNDIFSTLMNKYQKLEFSNAKPILRSHVHFILHNKLIILKVLTASTDGDSVASTE